MSVFDPDTPVSLDEMIKSADRALYLAKAAGKSAYRLADNGLRGEQVS